MPLEKTTNVERIRRVEAGIALIKLGKDPSRQWMCDESLKEYLGLSDLGTRILYVNGITADKEVMEQNGFIYSEDGALPLLHNWEHFLKLIRNLK